MSKDVYHHGDLREALLKKGLELLNSKGVDEFSLRKVACMCGVSHSAPYKHFKNKDEFIEAIYNTVIGHFRDCLSEVRKKYFFNPKLQIIEMGKEYVRFMVENPDYLKFLFLRDNNQPVVISDNSFTNSSFPFSIFEKSALSFLKSISSSKNYSEMMLTMWSLVHGLAVLLVNNSISYDGDYMDLVDSIVRKNVELVYRSLGNLV